MSSGTGALPQVSGVPELVRLKRLWTTRQRRLVDEVRRRTKRALWLPDPQLLKVRAAAQRALELEILTSLRLAQKGAVLVCADCCADPVSRYGARAHSRIGQASAKPSDGRQQQHQARRTRSNDGCPV